MYKCIGFGHEKFGEMEVMILPEENRMLFSDKFLRKCLDVKNKQLPWCGEVSNDGDVWVELSEVFDYIRYARTDEETRWLFNEWISEIIMDCSKLL